MSRPLAPNEIRITAQRAQTVYVTYALHAFEGSLPHAPGIAYDFVILRGMGQSIQTCVNIAEILKKRLPGLFQNTHITSELVQKQKGNGTKGKRSKQQLVAYISVKLSKTPLDPEDVGFQPPAIRTMKRVRIALVGCDMSGKTTLHTTMQGEMEVAETGQTFLLEDAGPDEKQWGRTLNVVHGMVWIVDATDALRCGESKSALLRCRHAYPYLPYVVLLNQKRFPPHPRQCSAIVVGEVWDTEQHVSFPCDCQTGRGVQEAMEYLASLMPQGVESRF